MTNIINSKKAKYHILLNHMISEYDYTGEELATLLEQEKIIIPTDDTDIYTIDNMEFLVLDTRESYQATKSYILNSLWAFNPSFLARMTNLGENVFTTLSNLCEDSNEAIKCIINSTCGISEFVSEAIETDGEGHFLAQYDNKEHIYDNYHLYRVN